MEERRKTSPHYSPLMGGLKKQPYTPKSAGLKRNIFQAECLPLSGQEIKINQLVSGEKLGKDFSPTHLPRHPSRGAKGHPYILNPSNRGSQTTRL